MERTEVQECQVRKTNKVMNLIARFMIWAPRVLAIIITLFMVLIAAGNDYSELTGNEKTAVLLSNLTPMVIMLTGIITGWKRKSAGGIIIMVLGAVMTFLFRKYGDLVAYLPLATPVLVTGILYILAYLYEKPGIRKT